MGFTEATDLACPPDGDELEDTGACQHRDDQHHAEQQEDDVPVRAGMLGQERVPAIGHRDEQHRDHTAQYGCNPVHPLLRDQHMNGGEDGHRKPRREAHRASLGADPTLRTDFGPFSPAATERYSNTTGVGTDMSPVRCVAACIRARAPFRGPVGPRDPLRERVPPQAGQVRVMITSSLHRAGERHRGQPPNRAGSDLYG